MSDAEEYSGMPPHGAEQLAGGLRCAAVSDVGMRRSNNQDSMALSLADNPERFASRGHLLMVADGMGAHAAGELASQMAADTIPHSYHKRVDSPPGQAIVEAVVEANNLIYAKGQNSVDFQGMGTTCSCLLLLETGAMAAHVGDSRVYRLRDDRFEQLTFDHSLVWEIAAAGQASEEEVPAYVPKNVITRSLGPHPTVSVDLEGPFPVQTGDKYLLCSDGLTGPLGPELIGMVLGALPPAEASQTLVDLANLLGGPDNITVVAAEVCDHKRMGECISCEDPCGATVSSGKTGWSVGPLATGLGAAAAGVAAAVGQPIVAGGFVVLALAACGYWLATGRSHQPAATGGDSQLAGKAPYRTHPCEPSAEKIATLIDIVRQLEDLEDQTDWDFDWTPIHEDRQGAYQAMAGGDYRQAVVSYSSAVRRMMRALREHGSSKSSDSSVDLT
ncbi:MAG: protein phosphatase 2C domain-containing protein [Planctomycetota bacterium]